MKATGLGALIAVTVSSVIAAVFVFSPSAAVESVYPVQNAKRIFARKVWSRVVGVFRAAEANAENVRLRREVASLSLLSFENERLEKENERLRKTLGYQSRDSKSWLACGVLSRDGGAAGAHSTLRVDKGSNAGVAKGAVAVSPDGLVGVVTKVTCHTAEITLITDSSSRISCEIENGGSIRPRGFIVGGSEEFLTVDYLEKRDIKARSRVITSGVTPGIPRGIAIGTYLEDGKILPSVDYSSLEDVFIRREK